MSDPFSRAPEDPEPKRQLVEEMSTGNPPAVQDESVPTGPSETEITELFDGFVKQINKATALLQVVTPEAEKLFVPVDVDAVAVREAIRRKSQGADGSKITFDLYKDMIEFYIQSARKVSFEILGELTGDIATDAQKIKKYVKSGGKGLSTFEEFLLYADKWLILFMLNRLIGQMQGQEHRECTAAKTPQGSEEGPIAVREQLAVAALSMVLGLEDKHVLVAVDAANNNHPPTPDLIHKARALKQDDLTRAFTEAAGAQDHILITRYVENYVSRHPDGYSSWVAYRDLKNMREDAAITYVHAREYSKPHMLLMDYQYNSKHQEPMVGFFGQLAGVQVTRMTAPHYGALRSKLIGLEVGTNAIAGVLTSSISLDVICCLARFLGRQDVKNLRKIRKMLEITQAAMGGTLSASLDPLSLMDYISSALIQRAVAYLDQIFDKAIVDVYAWFGAKTPDEWAALYECPLIMDLIAYIMQAINRLHGIMNSMIQKYLGNISLGYQGIYRRWGTIHDIRINGTLIAVIDRILAEIEMCADFRDNPEGGDTLPPDPADDPGLGDLAPKPLHIPPEIVESLFTNKNPIPRGPGFRPIPAAGSTMTTADMANPSRSFRELCHGVLPDALLTAVAEKGSK